MASGAQRRRRRPRHYRGWVGPHYNELRLTRKGWSRIDRKMSDNAKARVEHRFHYAFVDEADDEAVAW